MYEGLTSGGHNHNSTNTYYYTIDDQFNHVQVQSPSISASHWDYTLYIDPAAESRRINELEKTIVELQLKIEMLINALVTNPYNLKECVELLYDNLEEEDDGFITDNDIKI